MSNARLRSLFSPFHSENQLIHPAARREKVASWVVVKKEGRKTRRERKISGVFVFPPQAVTKALIFGFSYLFCYFYFYFLHLSGNFSYFLVTVTNLYIHFI